MPPCQTARSQHLQPSSDDIKRLFWKIQTENGESFSYYINMLTRCAQVLGTLWSGLISLISPMCVPLTSCTYSFSTDWASSDPCQRLCYSMYICVCECVESFLQQNMSRRSFAEKYCSVALMDNSYSCSC